MGKIRRYALVDRTRCVSCGACAQECPKGIIGIWKGCYAVVREAECIGCGRCAKVCPADCIGMKEREDGCE